MQSVRSHQRPILLLNCIGVMSDKTDASLVGARSYWHASHVGSSIAQNLMSLAGAAFCCACEELGSCASAAAAAASSADIPPALPPLLTALSRPDCTVDFSACVALEVRR